MKYIKCFNYLTEVSFVNVDRIVNIAKTTGNSIVITTVKEETFLTDVESLKNPIVFEKISEII